MSNNNAINAPLPLSPTQGGTGIDSPASHTLPVAQGASSFNFVGPLTDGKFLAGVTGSDPKSYTAVAGTNMDSIAVDPTAGTLTFNAATQDHVLQNLFYIADNGNDSTGLTTTIFATLQGFYSAVTPSSASQYVVFDIRGKATETDILCKPFVKVYGFGTELTVDSISLDSQWNTLSSDAYASFGYYNRLIINNDFTLDFRTAAFSSGRRYQFYIFNMLFRVAGSIKLYGLYDTSMLTGCATVYINDSNITDTTGGNNTLIECDYGIFAYLNTINLPAYKILNSSLSNSITTIIIKNNIVLGNVSGGPIFGIQVDQPSTSGANVYLQIYNTQIIANANQLLINSNNTGGIISILMDSDSYVTYVATGSGVQGTNYIIETNTNVSAINSSIDTESFTPTNYIPVQSPDLNYLNPVSYFKGIDNAFNFPNIIYLYVSPNGNNSTAVNGSLLKPYLTKKAACDAVISLGDASASKIYVICSLGIIVESADVNWPPFTYALGDGSLWNLNGHSLKLASTWTSDNQYAYLFNINLSGQTISFNSLSSNSRIINFVNCIDGDFLLDAPNENTVLKINNNNTLRNPFVVGGGGIVSVLGGTLLINGGIAFGNLVLHANTGNVNANLQNCQLPPILQIIGDDFPLSCYINKCDSSSNATALTLDGSFAQLTIDDSVSDTQITVLGGAVINSGGFTTSQMIKTGFVPVNSTPTSPPTGYPTGMLKQTLQGMDNQLKQYNPAYIYKLNLIWTGGSTINISPGKCRDRDDTFNIIVNNNISLDLGTVGTGGLDLGTPASATWYYVYVIADKNNVNPVSGLFSISSTSPLIPGGYNTQRLVGLVRTDAFSASIKYFFQFGINADRTYYWNNNDISQNVLINGNATNLSPGQVDATAVMSPLSRQASFNYAFTPNSAGNNFVIISSVPQIIISGAVMGQIQNGMFATMTASNQTFDYYVSSSSDSLDLSAISYIENLQLIFP